MIRLIVLGMVIFAGAAAWKIGSQMSSEAMAMAVGVGLGMLAGVPGAVIAMTVLRRQPPPAAPPPSPPLHRPPAILIDHGAQHIAQQVPSKFRVVGEWQHYD